MRISFSLAILAACLLAPSIAAADAGDEGSGWYLNGGLGLSHASEPAPLIGQTPGPQLLTTYSSSTGDQDSTAVELGGGYWFGPNGGLQAEYLDLGQYTHFVHGRRFLDCQLCGSEGFVESSKVKVEGMRIAFTPRYAFSEGFELIGRAGIYVNQVTYYDVTNFGVPSFQKYPQKRVNVAPELGVSLGWHVTEHWEALVGLDDYFKVGDSKYGTFNLGTLTVAVQYHF